jgi:pantetheine-phosphate adenylyltransferase
MRRALYPGTFDPITLGHLDIIERSLQIFDEVVVSIADTRRESLFTVEERADLVRRSTSHLDNLRVATFRQLLVDYWKEEDKPTVIRGLRAIQDFEAEFAMALANRKLSDDFEILFLLPRSDYVFLSATVVREIARWGGDVSSMVPPVVAESLATKFRQDSSANDTDA